MNYKIAALYRFVPVENILELRAEIYRFAENCDGICGTLLLAPEGVNGTIGATPDALDSMIDFLDSQLGITQGELKYSVSENRPFNKFKVRPKKEIVTLKAPEADPNQQVGDYVDPENWNELLNDPEVVLVDTRNDYETRIGMFRGAIDPNIQVFTEFKKYVAENMDPSKQKKVAMFCTGGIRCEKASSYMLSQGFENVYHLKGGILKYLETVPKEESLWDGECFVFDNRVSVKHGLEEGNWTICHGCREPLSEEEVQDAQYEKGVSCLYCAADLTEDRRTMLRQRQEHYQQRFANE